MQISEISQFVSQRLSEQSIVVLGGGDVLGKENFIGEPLINIVGVVPIVLALMLHDLYYSAAVDLPHILVV